MSKQKIDRILQLLRLEDSRWDAILELKLIQGKEYTPYLLPYLDDPDWVIRWCITEKLGELKDQRSIPHLLKVFIDSDAHVRKNATKAFYQFGLKPLKQIIPFLGYPNADVRNNAVSIIKHHGTRGLTVLEKAVPEHNWVIANRLVWLIAVLGGTESCANLIRLLRIEYTQKQTILLLGRLKSQKAIPYLLNNFNKPYLRRAILHSLMLIGIIESFAFMVKSISSKSVKLATFAEMASIKIGKPIIPYILKALEQPHSNYSRLLKIIVRLGISPYMTDIHRLAQKNPKIKSLTVTLRKTHPKKHRLLNIIGIKNN